MSLNISFFSSEDLFDVVMYNEAGNFLYKIKRNCAILTLQFYRQGRNSYDLSVYNLASLYGGRL